MALRRATNLLHVTRHASLFSPLEAAGCSQMHALPSLQSPATHYLTQGLWSLKGHISTSAIPAASIKVPSMGESIEEGTISAILKKKGDSVEMDEAIFQIETDKVTVDVRTPEAGVLDDIMVKEDDTVRVGQDLASVSAGSGSEAKQAPQKEQKDPKPKDDQKPQKEASKQPSQEDTTSKPATKVHSDTRDPHSSVEGQSESQPNADAGRVSIRFPKRRTPDGRRISDLPIEEQEQYRKQDAPQQTQHEQQQQPPAKPEAQAPARQPQKASASDPNKYIPYPGQDRGTKLSQARVLSAREIEIIELGGADP